jgi:DNA-binding NarL/FixJ family response regulator
MMLTCTDHTLRVLIADDHWATRQALRNLLGQFPEVASIDEAEDGARAVLLARHLVPDVVIMDLFMPVMSGLEATRRIKQELPDTTVIGFTFTNDAHLLWLMRQAGASQCLSKDTPSDRLSATIRKTLRSSARHCNPAIR